MKEKKIRSGEIVILSKDDALLIIEALEILIEDLENDYNPSTEDFRKELDELTEDICNKLEKL